MTTRTTARNSRKLLICPLSPSLLFHLCASEPRHILIPSNTSQAAWLDDFRKDSRHGVAWRVAGSSMVGVAGRVPWLLARLPYLMTPREHGFTRLRAILKHTRHGLRAF